MLRPVVLAFLLTACRAEPSRDDSSRTVSGGSGASAASGVIGGESTASGKPACPATGLWSLCAVVERLDRAGLAPRVDSTAAPSEPPLTARGLLVRVGNADLEIYVYPTVDARRRAIARVDTLRYLSYTEAVSMQQLPTLIQAANLVAILHSRNDLQRERVGDALTAGPPQPSSGAPQRLAPASSAGRSSPSP